MGLLSIFQRKNKSPPAAEAAPDAVAQARARALRRLIGAAVLLGLGVVGFPLLFETQPRPIRLDIPIEIARKDGMPVSPAPVAAVAAPAAVIARPPAAAVADPAPEPPVEATPTKPAPPAPGTKSAAVITERAGEQGREVSADSRAASVGPVAVPKVAPAAPARVGVGASASPSAADDGARARALLEGQSALPPKAGASADPSARIVVQVGAYADAEKLRDVRQRVEKLGLKTYTQVVESDGAKKTRVRVGPFPSRFDADQTAARLRAAGLPVQVLTL